MRAEFVKAIETLGLKDEKLIFLTGDLGFNAFENLVKKLGRRFINAGVAEQNMFGVAAGLAYMGFRPWVYSIAPFATLKTVEQVRNDICHLGLPVKIVGIGGGYGYGIMGSTHHVLEDISFYNTLPGIKVYVPAFSEDVGQAVKNMHRESQPGYLRLNIAKKQNLKLPAYGGVRKIFSGEGMTLVVLGPLIHNALDALKYFPEATADLWSVTEFPLKVPTSLIHSIKKTKKLLVVEECTNVNGLGERLEICLYKNRVCPRKLSHLYARGYPSRLYGSHQFHWHENKLDAEGIKTEIRKLLT
jgi:transketolase